MKLRSFLTAVTAVLKPALSYEEVTDRGNLTALVSSHGGVEASATRSPSCQQYAANSEARKNVGGVEYMEVGPGECVADCQYTQNAALDSALVHARGF